MPEQRPSTPARFEDSATAPGSPPKPDLSVVIPVYNEARRIVATLRHVQAYLNQSGLKYEVIVVDDGSTDGLAEILLHNNESGLFSSLERIEPNCGKGRALRVGVATARGTLVLVCDADLSTPIEELEKLRRALDAGHDIAIASRDMPESRLEPPQPLLRRWLAWGFRWFRRRILLPHIRDTQCGFKLFRGDIAKELFGSAVEDRWLIDCEVLGLADQRGQRIEEVGVTWRNDTDTRVNVRHELFASIPKLLAIRRRLRQLQERAKATK